MQSVLEGNVKFNMALVILALPIAIASLMCVLVVFALVLVLVKIVLLRTQSSLLPILLCVSLSSFVTATLVRPLSPKVKSALLFPQGVFLALLDNGVLITSVPLLELLQVERLAEVIPICAQAVSLPTQALVFV